MSALEETLALQIRAAKLPEPEREYRFHPGRRWRADFCWPEKKIIVETEGGVWSNGRHVRGSGFEADMEKYNEASLMGYAVFRFSGSYIKSGKALLMIELALKDRAK